MSAYYPMNYQTKRAIQGACGSTSNNQCTSSMVTTGTTNPNITSISLGNFGGSGQVTSYNIATNPSLGNYYSTTTNITLLIEISFIDNTNTSYNYYYPLINAAVGYTLSIDGDPNYISPIVVYSSTTNNPLTSPYPPPQPIFAQDPTTGLSFLTNQNYPNGFTLTIYSLSITNNGLIQLEQPLTNPSTWIFGSTINSSTTPYSQSINQQNS